MVRIQDKRGRWLKADRTWSRRRKDAMVFASIPDAELELERVMIGWLGMVVFDVSEG